MTPADAIVRLRDNGLNWRALDDETVVLDLARSRYVSVNRAGSSLWAMLAEGATRAQLVAALRQAWGIEQQQAEQDVAAFCARLEGEGLLEP